MGSKLGGAGFPTLHNTNDGCHCRNESATTSAWQAGAPPASRLDDLTGGQGSSPLLSVDLIAQSAHISAAVAHFQGLACFAHFTTDPTSRALLAYGVH